MSVSNNDSWTPDFHYAPGNPECMPALHTTRAYSPLITLAP